MRFMICMALGLAVAIHAVAERPKRPERPVAQYYQNDGLQLYFFEQGEGEPVLLIHGSGATGNTNWRASGLTEILNNDYRIIVPDVRGHGRSETPDDNEYGVEDVDDMIALLDHLKIERVHLVGYSMGGMITIKLCTMIPDRIISATVGGMGWIEAGSEDAASFADTENDTKYRPSVQQFGEFQTTVEEMKALSMPIQAIIGTEDPGQVMRVGKWLDIVPNLQVTYVKGAEHNNCIQRDEFKNQIKAFIDEHSVKHQDSDG